MDRSRIALFVAWLITIVSVIGSLYFSEILHLPPCLLCWYQRIFMYPLVIILGIGLLRKDKDMPYYALPLSLLGLFIAIYHVLLYYGFIPESLAPCSLGISCTTKQIQWFGFVSIPLLSMIGFILITFASALALIDIKKTEHA